MLYENLQVKLATGETVDINELSRIDAALDEIRRQIAPKGRCLLSSASRSDSAKPNRRHHR
jgi:hypothetical protein